MCVDKTDNELIAMETIHHFVEVLDRYFGNVCELDLIFNFHKAYFVLDEVLLNGQLQETSKKAILRVISAQVRSTHVLLLAFFCFCATFRSDSTTPPNNPFTLGTTRTHSWIMQRTHNPIHDQDLFVSVY